MFPARPEQSAVSRLWLEHSPGKWRSFFLYSRWCERCPVCGAWLSAGRVCKCSLTFGCSPSCWYAADPLAGTLQQSVRGHGRRLSPVLSGRPGMQCLMAGQGRAAAPQSPSCREEQPSPAQRGGGGPELSPISASWF